MGSDKLRSEENGKEEVIGLAKRGGGYRPNKDGYTGVAVRGQRPG